MGTGLKTGEGGSSSNIPCMFSAGEGGGEGSLVLGIIILCKIWNLC